MPKTLLAVDDSTTMRTVLEITFRGEDFRVITAHSAESALATLADQPNASFDACVVDTVLGKESGYDLARQLRERCPDAAIVLLASRYAPIDEARSRDAGADDWADKPYDTQQLIDKVRRALTSHAQAEQAPASSPLVTGAAPSEPRPAGPPSQPFASPAPRAATPLAAAPRAATLAFAATPPSPPSLPRTAPPAPAPPPPRTPMPPQTVPRLEVAERAHEAVHSATSSMDSKIANLGLGLTPAQVDSIVALSREVVERVVWEVVPQLAETLIREEIARLTRDDVDATS